jgi:voltage-gated potassium channel
VTEQPERSDPRAVQWAERKFSGRMRPRDAAYLVATSWVLAVIVFGVVVRLADPNTFTYVWLGFWWAIQTVTTVGYGDIVPRQTSGKVLAAILMLGGLAFLSVITATITSAFVARRQTDLQLAGKDPVMQKLDQLSAHLDTIESELRDLRRG